MPESLSTIAELGIGLAGFSGVVVALGYRSQHLAPLDRMRVIGLLLGSLGAALLAILPLILAESGSTRSSVWRISSLVFAVGLVGFIAFAYWFRRALSEAERAALHPAIWALTIGGVVTFVPLLVWNSSGLRQEPSPGPYLSALYFLLVYSSAQFVRLLLVRPVDPPAA